MERLRNLKQIECPECGIVYAVTYSRYNKKNKVPLKRTPWLCCNCYKEFLRRLDKQGGGNGQ
jgi:DNA-directed RNA polymerase subunit RPC12/RpoP